MKKLTGLLAILFVLLVIGNQYDLIELPKSFFEKSSSPALKDVVTEQKQTVTTEESAVIDAIDKSLPSVVTIGISKTSNTGRGFEINPLDPFNPFRQVPGKKQQIDQNIGSGFIIAADGFIVTNKHVVADTEATYRVITQDKKEYKVISIAKDPLNDLAILKIEATNLKPLLLGSSDNLKLGQFVVAIGTPLGEFTNSVTSGIISGLGRGITAGSPYENFVERLDNVIQTDAAISPGNSGGPLINLKGEVIGVNTAVSQEGSNIGFAIPIDVVSDLLKNFNKDKGSIERPFLGVRYKIIDKENAILNKIPQGAYILEVVEGSPAAKAGIQQEDIITEFEGSRLTEDSNQTLAKRIASHKIGDKIKLKIYRDGKQIDKEVTLTPPSQ
ncbi:hypothetical protein A2690_05125 [Candidatus Roizmanbacteria bacterium RIFCSPHIGHO2_01_FULL_39_12b]|uniref:PDZ domain-containing protein n=1 Tax=Candidatus Roizmanbacteria bacterium RIFCSPHIGHO2_01_FULL_39_12b TaxID=1802030 RepID=A0A1F7G920_9BACT|nr:MAG: hypothetical protein A2690_05125 [Candidatus Roizmanbacteria bacterium RIFCSPHIGHO2_01_FULL_39_12b]OGK45908.1 MAG: hypothetical protein A3B46_03375 [Candidatus Roizmanbacteria bacterium RIFCSPLOWO2_01_FULL_39_19]